MEIKLNIGDIIKKPELKDVFILHVRSMSGDADEYHTNKFYSESNERDRTNRFNRLLEYFATYSKLEWNEQCYLRDGVLGHKDLAQFSDVEDDVRDLVGIDVTYDEYYARPDSVWVTYVDLVGMEHDVDIVIDGTAYTKIHRTYLEKK